MSFKDRLTSFLFGGKNGESLPEEELPLQEEPAAEGPETPAAPAADPALLTLTSDHPLYQLHTLRKKTVSRLPSPRLCLDEDGVLPLEVVEKEKRRLQSALKTVCAARWKSAGGSAKQSKPSKKGEKGEEEASLSLDALPWLFLSSDKLYAWLLVLPPVGQGREVSREMLYQALQEQGISFGLDTRLIDRLSRDDGRYFHLCLAAKGKPAFDGKNGNIVDYVPRVIERVLEVNEYDQVDYTALNLIHNVAEGQEICRLIRPTEGEPGRTVQDQEIPAKSGKAVPLPKGRNTEISEDGDALLASIAGHVEFTGRNFQVKPVLDIKGNVDFSTGSIKFLGDVNIKGDVLSGFSVQAMGNIWVGGVIESGSTVEAGGDLTVVKGILGDGSTMVRAYRCIFSKYVENATIYVRENLQTDCIMNSSIYCDGEVIVRSGRGSIIGGRIWAARKISANIVGARSECRTSVALGGLPCTCFERELVQGELKELREELERLESQLDNPVKESLLSKVRLKTSTAEMKLRQLEEDLSGAKIDLEGKDAGQLECGIAYAGTEITIGDERLRLRHETRHCTAVLACGEIVLM